eukprot:m.205377 g.205377  ORF g.205377 m.205377 type:complete len:572 (+) comp15409_c0_seq2:2143-3858(+)
MRWAESTPAARSTDRRMFLKCLFFKKVSTATSLFSSVGKVRIMNILFVSVVTTVLCGGAPSPAPPQEPWQVPRVHATPPCFIASGPHDIAGALFLHDQWHVMAGCWSKGGWQHMISTDLVHWRVVGEPSSFGGSGELVHDEELGLVVALANNLDAWTSPDDSNLTAWKSVGRLYTSPLGGQDPTVWRGRNNNWFAATASKIGHGYEDMWTGPSLQQGANWTHVGRLFEDLSSTLVPGHPSTKEFVTPQYFDGIPGGTDSTSVFLTSKYGNIVESGGIPRTGIYNYAMFYVGTSLSNETFVANRSLDQAVDWSCFVPSTATAGGFDLAYKNGGTQFGCCPKTSAGPNGRRVMFGWLQNGASDGNMPGRGPDTDNAFTLPRDLSLSPTGHILQRFVPELQTLRKTSGQHVSHFGLSHTDAAAAVPLIGINGSQLEIEATFLVNLTSTQCDFGLTVLSNQATEFTAVGINLSSVADMKGAAYIDRTHSGLPSDADVRAGPLGTSLGSTVTMHVFVDHSIVSVIVNNATALTVWVHPGEQSLFVGAYCSCDVGTVDVSAIGYQLRNSVLTRYSDC